MNRWVKQGLHQRQLYSYYSFLLNRTWAVKRKENLHALLYILFLNRSNFKDPFSIKCCFEHVSQHKNSGFLLFYRDLIKYTFLCYLWATTLQNIRQCSYLCMFLCVYSFKLRMGIINSCCILWMPIHGVLLVGFTIS